MLPSAPGGGSAASYPVLSRMPSVLSSRPIRGRLQPEKTKDFRIAGQILLDFFGPLRILILTTPDARAARNSPPDRCPRQFARIARIQPVRLESSIPIARCIP
jgi:hypothetical protein